MAKEALLKNTLSQYAFLPVNRCLIKNLGLTEAALIAMLVDSEALNQDENGWFYLTSAMGQSILNLGRKPYESALNNIVSNNIVETELRGCPPRKYFKLNHSKIISILSEEYLSGTDDSICPDCANQFVQNGQFNLFETDNKKEYNTNNNTTNKNITNNSGSKENKKKGLDLSFVNVAFLDIFNEWLDYKKVRGESYKDERSLEICYRKLLRLSNNDPHTAQLIIEEAMSNNYAGFFELKQSKQNNYGNSSNEVEGGFFCHLADSMRSAKGTN